MKATLTYFLPEEQSEFHLACHAVDYYSVLWALDSLLRSWQKWGAHGFKDADAAIDDIRDRLFVLMEERGVGFD